MHCPTNSLFFDIPLLHHYTSLNSSIICCLFLAICIFELVFPIDYCLHYFLSTLNIFSKHLLCYQQFYYQLNHQLLLLFFELLFLKQFLLHLLLIILHYQEVLDYIYCLDFYPCSTLGSIEYIIFIMDALFNY